MIRDFGMQDRILFSSFNHFSLMTLKQLEKSPRKSACCIPRPWWIPLSMQRT